MDQRIATSVMSFVLIAVVVLLFAFAVFTAFVVAVTAMSDGVQLPFDTINSMLLILAVVWVTALAARRIGWKRIRTHVCLCNWFDRPCCKA